VSLADEIIDLALMVNDERLEVVEVEKFGALSLWKDKVEEKEEAEPGVEGHPANDEERPRLSEEGQSEDNEVD